MPRAWTSKDERRCQVRSAVEPARPASWRGEGRIPKGVARQRLERWRNPPVPDVRAPLPEVFSPAGKISHEDNWLFEDEVTAH